MPLTPLRVRSRSRTLARAMPPRNVLLDSSRRRHLALLTVVLLVSVFGYVLLEPRKVRVQADGHEIVIETRASSDSALLSVAGVGLRPGDRVTSLEGDDALARDFRHWQGCEHRSAPPWGPVIRPSRSRGRFAWFARS